MESSPIPHILINSSKIGESTTSQSKNGALGLSIPNNNGMLIDASFKTHKTNAPLNQQHLLINSIPVSE